MEVKPGYKQTEVGIIPEEWELTSLVELIDETRSIRYGIVQPGRFDPTGRYMVRGQDYSKGWAAPTDLFKVSPQVEEPFKNARVKAGDVIITIVGASTGHIEVIPDWLDGANLTQTTARLAINPSKAFSGFCKSYLQSSAGQRQVASYLKGAAQPGLNCGDIEKFKIPLPPSLPEQRAIAAALSDVDGLLGGLDRLIAKKRDLKQAAMQQLLTGQTRLPGFHGEWEVKRFGEGIALHSGHHVLAQHCNTQSEGVPYLTGPADFPEGRIRHTKFTTRPSTICSRGDILVTVKGSGSGTIVLADAAYCISRQLMAIRVSDWDARFIYYSLLQNAGQFRAASTGLIPGLSRSDILDQPLPLPPTTPEQTAIAEVLTEMDGELAVLEQRREKTRALKQAMMQELLTGKTRLL